MRDAVERTRAEYLAAGVSRNFVWRALATPAQSMWFPQPEELVEANVLTGSDVYVTEGSERRRETLAEMRIRREMAANARHINTSVPVRLTEAITMERASASGPTLTHHYRVTLERVDIAGSRQQLNGTLRRRICSDVAMALAVSQGARFVHSYSNARGRHLFDVAITQCP
jgi:hypothetical protein